jgi:multidrug resistance efflux pump
MFYTFGENLAVSKGETLDGSIDENLTEENKAMAAKAFGIQAAESGQVADSTIGRYNELIAKEGLTDDEAQELKNLRETMKAGLERANANLEAQKTIQETTNRVAEALYNIGQAEIDKLS